MLALVAQLLSNATIKPQLRQSDLVSHVVTTLLKSTCSNRFKYVHVPLQLRDFALFISFWGGSVKAFSPDQAMGLNSVLGQGVWKKLFRFRMFPMSS